MMVATLLGLAAWGGACDGPEPEREPSEREPLVSFDTVPAAVVTGEDTLEITAELADTGDRRRYGLMERSELPADRGMLFVYPERQAASGSFWMYRTEVPLDIGFLDADGTIVAILAMDPCTSPNPELCRRYSPGVPYRGALEMRQGYFEEHGVSVGDRVIPAPGEVPALY